MVTNSRKDSLQSGRSRGKRKARLKTSYAESSGSEEASTDEEDFEPSPKMRKRSTGRTPSRARSTVSRTRKARTPMNIKQNAGEEIIESSSRSSRGMNIPVGSNRISFP